LIDRSPGTFESQTDLPLCNPPKISTINPGQN
jgi:hypothetical protein